MGSKTRIPFKPIIEFEGTKFYLTERGRPYYYRSRYGHRLHRVIAEKLFGSIPKGYHVHHKNGDIADNSPANLEILSPSEHYRRHQERIPRICIECGIEFLALLKKQQRFCSQLCGKLWRDKERTREAHLILKICEWCGNSFNGKRSDARHCSIKCQVARNGAKFRQKALT